MALTLFLGSLGISFDFFSLSSVKFLSFRAPSIVVDVFFLASLQSALSHFSIWKNPHRITASDPSWPAPWRQRSRGLHHRRGSFQAIGEELQEFIRLQCHSWLGFSKAGTALVTALSCNIYYRRIARSFYGILLLLWQKSQMPKIQTEREAVRKKNLEDFSASHSISAQPAGQKESFPGELTRNFLVFSVSSSPHSFWLSSIRVPFEAFFKGLENKVGWGVGKGGWVKKEARNYRKSTGGNSRATNCDCCPQNEVE